MHRTPSYILLFIVMALLQIFLFNNLAISSFFCPLVYLTFLVLLPLESTPILMLGLGLLMGIVMDATMGIAGINLTKEQLLDLNAKLNKIKKKS